jgi:hypothetical protein
MSRPSRKIAHEDISVKSKIDCEQPVTEPGAALMVASGETTEHPIRSDRQRCHSVKGDGESCRAKAQIGSSFCYFHDSKSVDERIAASRRGGEKNRRSTLPPETPDFPLASATDASKLIGRTINQLLRGEIDPKIANAVGYLVTVKIKATDAGALERRVAALEAALLNPTEPENGGNV